MTLFSDLPLVQRRVVVCRENLEEMERQHAWLRGEVEAGRGDAEDLRCLERGKKLIQAHRERLERLEKEADQ